MPDNRIVFHYNRKHNEDQTIPPWIVKTRGMTYQVHHFTSEVGFSTKETPNNPSTKGSLQMRGFLTLLHENGRVEAVITEQEPQNDENRNPNDCAECARSYGPWYDGECEH